jgi:hypothetical protein
MHGLIKDKSIDDYLYFIYFDPLEDQIEGIK